MRPHLHRCIRAKLLGSVRTGEFLPAAGEIPSLITELRQVECVWGNSDDPQL